MSLEELIEKLKSDLVEERVSRICESIPRGHCPNAYYRVEYTSGCEDEQDVGCDECRIRFTKAMYEQVKKAVDKEYSIK